jgi:IS1 family transposase
VYIDPKTQKKIYKHQKYLDKRVWLAVNRNERRIESCIVGTSDQVYASHCLIQTLTNCKDGNINTSNPEYHITNTIRYICTDGNYAYDKVIPNLCDTRITKHIIDKAETCLVEAYNSSMRDRLARLGRRTKAYSKSKEMLELSLAIWVERKNTGRRDWKNFLTADARW